MKSPLELYNEQVPNLTRLSKASEYPARFEVADNETSWDIVSPKYADRPYCLTDWLAKAILKGIAESESMLEVDRSFDGFRLDEIGRPLHPQGRTGIGGRGHLYKWGEGLTVDSIIARHTVSGDELLVIRKPGETKPALPGGFIELKEDIVEAALRETEEETGVNVNSSLASTVGKIITRSKRTTDNAWITTSGVFIHPDSFKSYQTPVGGDDAAEASWLPLTSGLLRPMSDHHRVLVQTVVDSGEICLSD